MLVALRNRDDEPKVRADQRIACRLVSGVYPPRELDLVGRVDERILVYGSQVRCE